MTKVLAGLGVLVLAAGAAHAAQITTQLTTSNAVDAPLNSNAAYVSSSYYNYLGKVEGGSLVTKVLIRFDLPALPAGSVVNSATLRIQQYGSGNTPDDTLGADVHAVLKDWDNNLTYNTYDGTNNWSSAGLGSGTDYEAAAATSLVFGTPSLYSIDITGQYQQWFSGAEANYGLVLIPTTNSTNDYIELAATDPLPGSDPAGVDLVIDYTVVPEPAAMGLVGLAGLLIARRRNA